MDEIRYRRATEADVAAMSALRLRAGWEGGGTEERMRMYMRGEHHPQHARPERVVFLAEAGDAPVAFIAGHLTSRMGCSGELQWLLVGQEARGRGVSDALWRLLAAWFVAHGAADICVNVEPGNAAARAFYARHGAMPHSTHWMVWRGLRRPD